MIERLQKFFSNAGIASRRGSEILIEKGLVRINGNIAKLGDKVDPSKDQVTYDGKLVRPTTELYYIAVNKPKGYISSRYDPKERRSVYRLLPRELQSKVWSVGRLDFFTEGLLLFTNDGELTQQLAHPKYEHEKEYEVIVSKEIEEKDLDKLRKGIVIGENDLTQPAKIKVRGDKIYMTIHEGKKRQIRRMFDKIDYKIKNLKRIRINKLEMGDLPSGKHKFVEKSEII
ncbi:MAG: ribosomal large subunit pseudouridine synthase [Candidatus Doudnabacteria bacterium]|nr:ribosomal large subunit pseudouridine synthase [Candidatus Doudnabacteria bacterium]